MTMFKYKYPVCDTFNPASSKYNEATGSATGLAKRHMKKNWGVKIIILHFTVHPSQVTLLQQRFVWLTILPQ